MIVFYGSNELKLADTAVALGDFDGMHKGHCEIIESMIKYSKEENLRSVVYMFSSNPNKNMPRINSLEKRLEILDKMGVEFCVVEEFSETYKNTSCVEFVERYIEKALAAKAVFAGFNYRFGKGAAGDIATLKKLCLKKSIKVFACDCVRKEDIAVSSTFIRNLIEKGEAEKAAEFLGRAFSLEGVVVKGKQIGRTIGFPTANIDYPEGMIVPKCGVYITRTKIRGDSYCSVTNVGAKPTLMDERQNIETTVENFSEDIYGEKIEIEFYALLRDISKFNSLAELKNQLKKDMEAAEKYFCKGENL